MKYISSIKSAINAVRNKISNGAGKILDKTIGVFEMVVLGIIVISVVSYALAWQAPSGNPPTGNTDTPINTGSSGQAKSGGLILNTGGAATGLIVQNGNVGIGTAGPGGKLSVFGSDRVRVLTAYNDGTRDYGIYQWDNGGGSGNPPYNYFQNNVGIGETNPSQKLEVNGYIKGNSGVCVGNNCKTNWPTISCVTVTAAGAGPQTAYCPAGYIVTGGGGKASPTTLDTTRPDGDNAWYTINEQSGQYTESYARCCKVE